MPSKIETNLQTIIDQFTPDILGVFWITNEELSRDLLGFDEFNYLFDGLISLYVYGQTEINTEINLHRSNVFFTRNFNQKLFLTHLESNPEIKSILDDQMKLVLENKNSERKKIVIFDQTKNNLDKDLQKRYPDFEFINLKLS